MYTLVSSYLCWRILYWRSMMTT